MLEISAFTWPRSHPKAHLNSVKMANSVVQPEGKCIWACCFGSHVRVKSGALCGFPCVSWRQSGTTRAQGQLVCVFVYVCVFQIWCGEGVLGRAARWQRVSKQLFERATSANAGRPVCFGSLRVQQFRYININGEPGQAIPLNEQLRN